MTTAASAAALEVRGLRKTYGDFTALDGVDLDVAEGTVFGFLGPNGAGKTTTLRIVTGLAAPDAGSVRLFGHGAASAEARRVTGFLPDVPGFYGWMTAPEFLRFVGNLFGLEGAVLSERVELLLGLAGLDGVNTRIGGYSRGMKQRLGIAQALVNAPRLLLLDEPTSALDPIGRKEVLDMVVSLKGRTTVFFSTHILSDVERVCDEVAVLDHGRVVTQSSIAELKGRYGRRRLEIDVTGDANVLASALADRSWATDVQVDPEGRLSIAVADLAAAQTELPGIIDRCGLGLKRMDSGEVTLEDVFVDLVGAGRGPRAEEVAR